MVCHILKKINSLASCQALEKRGRVVCFVDASERRAETERTGSSSCAVARNPKISKSHTEAWRDTEALISAGRSNLIN